MEELPPEAGNGARNLRLHRNAIVHQRGLNQGVAMLQKPFTPSALACKVREMLDQPGLPKPDPGLGATDFTNPSDAPKPPGN